MKKLVGMLAAIALVGAPAFAGGDKADKWGSEASKTEQSSSETATQGSESESELGVGGSGQMGQSGSKDTKAQGSTEMKSGEMAESKELSGKILKVTGNTVYLEHMGAAVPIELSKNTTFEGEGLKSKKDLKKGQDIRASFTIKNESKNMASSISSSGGTGGAFEEGTTGESGSQEYEETDSSTGGTGGSGLENTGDEGDATFDTGDTSNRSPGTIPEGNEAGSGSPIPESETY